MINDQAIPAYISAWQRDAGMGAVSDSSTVEQARLLFLQAHANKLELVSGDTTFTLQADIFEVAASARSALENPSPLQSAEAGHVLFYGMFHNEPVLVAVWRGERQDHDYNTEPGETVNQAIITVGVTGSRDALDAIFQKIDSDFRHQQFAQIKWWHTGRGEPATRTIYLDPLKTELKSEFYPDLELPPAQFLKSYLESNAAILLISGAPGTGKTTLLRHLISDFKLAAHVVYDEKLMSDDRVFQRFLFDKGGDILIIEDADTILADRERENNKMMARFLNVSDGLIKLPDKKVVFTTNISDFDKVDSALRRPGRCFAELHTRALNLTEAQAAARAAKLPVPMEKREYTLAELFNQRQGIAPRRVGFQGGGR